MSSYRGKHEVQKLKVKRQRNALKVGSVALGFALFFTIPSSFAQVKRDNPVVKETTQTVETTRPVDPPMSIAQMRALYPTVSVEATKTVAQYKKVVRHKKTVVHKKRIIRKKASTVIKVKASGNGAAIIRRVGSQMGCSSNEINMLLYIAIHESSLRTNAVSKSGTYVGLFQLGPHLGSYSQRIDPVWNTTRAIKYMRGRYGSISRAYNFKKANGWY